MVVPRLLVLAFLSSAFVAPAVAQSSWSAPSGANPFQSQWPQKGVAPPLQFGPQVATPSSPGGQAEPFKLHGLAPQVGRVIVTYGDIAPAPSNKEACYAIRSYDFKRQNPTSDATRFAGSSTCLPASSAQLKAVADPRVVVGRQGGTSR